MNEIKENKEIKAEEIRMNISNCLNKIRHLTYGIIRILTNKSDNNNYNNNNIIGMNENNKNEIDKNDMNKLLLNHWDNIKKTIEYLKYFLNLFKYTSNFNIKDYYSKIFSTLNYYNKLLFFQRNNINIIIYKNLIDSFNNKILRDLIIYEIKFYEFQLSRLRVIKLMKQKIEDSKPINDYINEFINNNFNEQPNPKKENEIGKQKIYFNCEILSYESELIAEITIEFFIFNIVINIPYNKKFNAFNFLYKIILFIKFKYYFPDDPYKRKKEKELINISDYESKKRKILKNKNFFLINKMNNYFESKIYSILKSITEEKKSIDIEKSIIIEFCKRFIYYIHDYNNLFNTKCGICNKIVKYSINEKCFYPPYIKIYKERDSIKINNEENIKYFYHDVCYKNMCLINL